MKRLFQACATVVLLSMVGQRARAETVVFVWGFQQGNVAAVDPKTGQVIQRFPVRDGTGIASVAVTSNGRTLFVVDDTGLRVMDASGRVASRHQFSGVRHMLGGGPYIHLTGDDRFLLVRTYDLESAASGARIFDVSNHNFAGVGLRGRACPDPELASSRDGSLFLLCPGLVQAMKPAGMTGDFLEARRADLRAEKIASFAASNDNRVYALEPLESGKRWRLHRWAPGDRSVSANELAEMATDAPDSVAAHLAASPDSRWLALLHGRRAWLLDPSSLKVAKTFNLPVPGADLAFSSDGAELLVLGEPAQITRIAVSDGRIDTLPVKGLSPTRGPRLMTTAPAAR